MILRIIVSIYFMIWVGVVSAFAQPDSVSEKLSTYLQNNFREKLYLHADKQSYLAGEIIWFKIYQTEAYTNRPVRGSKVAYVEVLDADNQPVLQSKIELTSDGGSGSFFIPVSTASGSYTLRCYTSWMKNFEPSYFFNKRISIYNTLTGIGDSKDNAMRRTFSLQFFPEGGNLVSGLGSRVAFRAVDSYGQKFDFRATILNATNQVVARFNSTRLGIGSFDFIPRAAESYYAIIEPAVGEIFSVPLPKVHPKGIVMSIKPLDRAMLKVSLQSNVEPDGEYTLFIHSGRRVVYETKVNPGNVQDGVSVPLVSLGDGISHFTLFNSIGEPICERLYFKRPESLSTVEVTANQPSYMPREKVLLTVNQNHRGKPLKGNYSISVYHADSSLNEDDIAANLWLNSELNGRIDNASWYLREAPQEAVDNLMLSHGWRRFNWDEVFRASKKPLKYLPEIDGHIVTARLLDSKTEDRPLENKTVFLSIPGLHYQFYTASSDKDGLVNFYTRNLYGGKELVVQTDFRRDSLIKISIDSPFSTKVIEDNSGPAEVIPDSSLLLKRSVAMQVNNTFNGRKLSSQLRTYKDTSYFYHRTEKIYKLDDYVRFATMEEVLREYIPEIRVILRKKDFHLNIFNENTREHYDQPPLTLIDGVPVFDEGNSVISLNPWQIQRLEIIEKKYIYGQNIFPGIASFHSYKGDLAGYRLPEKALVVDYEGLQNKREFYSPMYDGDTPVSSRVPDYRATLFWSADNQFDESGRSALSFFTSDLDGKYVVNIQSLSIDGNTGSATTIINVTPPVTSHININQY